MQTLEKLREVGDSFGTITEFSEGYCCESFLLPQYFGCNFKFIQLFIQGFNHSWDHKVSQFGWVEPGECARFGRIHDSNIDRNAFCIATVSTKFEPLAGWSATFVL